MTVTVQRIGPTQSIRVEFANGSAVASISEHYSSLKHVWNRLGELIHEIENEQELRG